jgi:hypothetical protein
MARLAPPAPRLGRSPLARPALAASACVSLAAASLALPSAPTYDPWAWIVFGKELVHPGIGFSTISGTGWKPLPVLFTAPLALLGDAGPSLWLVVVRSAGIAAVGLAFGLAARAAGLVAGFVAALALVLSSDWLRYLAAGNIEPVVVALLLGGVELHLRGRRAGAFVVLVLAGLGRPEVWPLVAGYAGYLWLNEQRRWPVALALPCMLALWAAPEWVGSGDPLHTLQAASRSGEPHSLQLTHHPALELVRGAAGILAAPVWIGALIGVAYGWRARDRTALALAAVAGAWALPTIVGTALGYPAVPRYLVEPAALCCALAGIGFATLTRLPYRRAASVALAATLVAASVPFAVSRVVGLVHQTTAAEQRADDLASLWQAVDRARTRAAVARLHPAVEPGASGNALAWKLDLQLHDVTGALSPRVKIAFLQDWKAAAARLRLRGATTMRLTASGPWTVVLIHWGARPGTPR